MSRAEELDSRAAAILAGAPAWGAGFDTDAFNASKDPREHTHDLPNAEGGTSRVYCVEVHPVLSDVWCNQCDKPAVEEFKLTNDETVAKCNDHAWLLRAPRGQR